MRGLFASHETARPIKAKQNGNKSIRDVQFDIQGRGQLWLFCKKDILAHNMVKKINSNAMPLSLEFVERIR